jgi:hypothetical protein
MALKRGRFRARGADRSYLRIKSTLATSGLGERINPMNQNVFLQLRTETEGEFLCAWVPAGKFMKSGKAQKYWRKMNPAPTAENIDDMKVRTRRSGQVRFRAYGRRVEFTTPPAGDVQITVAFQDPGGDAAKTSCSAGLSAFRSSQKGIRYP